VAETIIQTRNLSKRFADGNLALEGIDLDIYAGEIFGIIGKSGAGKSTLARCLNLLEKPTGGEVFFGGESLSTLKGKALYQRRQGMGMIFQQFNLFMQRSVLDNVRFPMEIAGFARRAARVRAEELLELVKLGEKADSFPARLSGGQRQRVAIARALALNPRVLICDEATSALDPETTRDILALLRDINERFQITMVMITHEMQVVQGVCHRVAVLDQSRLAETGPVREVFSNPQSKAAQALLLGEERSAALLLQFLKEKGLSLEEVLSRV
jgi:D-methionine transport system ATP-binding protein